MATQQPIFEEILLLLRETDLKSKEVMAGIGRLGNRLGEFVEEMVRPGAVRLFRSRGFEVHEVHQNVSARREEGEIEVESPGGQRFRRHRHRVQERPEPR